MEQIIQIIVIITFIGSTIAFFVKLGEYKSIINTDIESVKKEIGKINSDIKNFEKDLEEIKTKTNETTSKLETVLVEIKTKLELFMQYSGMFDGHKNNKN